LGKSLKDVKEALRKGNFTSVIWMMAKHWLGWGVIFILLGLFVEAISLAVSAFVFLLFQYWYERVL
jgi:hypothetical protein